MNLPKPPPKVETDAVDTTNAAVASEEPAREVCSAAIKGMRMTGSVTDTALQKYVAKSALLRAVILVFFISTSDDSGKCKAAASDATILASSAFIDDAENSPFAT
jgi:hypothetical protein